MSADGTDTLLEFPCEFSIKAMGLADGDFEALVLSLVRAQVPDFAAGASHTRPSSSGKYVSVTVHFTATSKAQIDAIYQSLVDEPRVRYAL